MARGIGVLYEGAGEGWDTRDGVTVQFAVSIVPVERAVEHVVRGADERLIEP